MCGIFGAVTRSGAALGEDVWGASLRLLAREAQSRGKDSSGLVVREEHDHRYRVFKGALPMNALLASREWTDFVGDLRATRAQPRAVPLFGMGHSRLVTNGSQLNSENNQPVVKDGLVGIHNGIIVNDDALWRSHPELVRRYQIDTEVMLSMLAARLAAGEGIAHALHATVEQTEGTVSAAILSPVHDALVLYTNNGSLYTLTDGKAGFFFASESYPLRVLARRFGLSEAQGYKLSQRTKGEGVVCRLDDLRLEWFDARSTDAGTDAPTAGPPADARILVQDVTDGRPQLELVSDVAVIAASTDAARFERLLEHNHERVAALRRCSKCLLPETFPFIQYDAQGECNYCGNYKIRNQPKPLNELLELIQPYRRADGTPDCIVPFSGGRDSTYALHFIREELKLNPIAFTYDWGMVTDLGRRNIARVCGKLGVENIIVAADIHWKRRNIHKNIMAWLRKPHLGMIPLFMAGDKYFYYYIDRVKRQTDVKLNLWGINPMENTDFKVGFMGVAPDFHKKHIYSLSLLRQLKLFSGVGKAVLQNPGYINGSMLDTFGSFLSRSVKSHTDYFHLYDYLHWDEETIDRLILDEYHWEKAIDTDTTWRIGDGTAAFYNYVYFNVAGFSEHDTFRSNQIREGVIDRERALELVNRENRPRYPTIKWYLDAVDVDFEHAISTVNRIPKLYA